MRIKNWEKIDMSPKNLQIEYKVFVDISVKTTIQVLCNVGLVDRFEIKDEVFKVWITLKKKWRRNLKTEVVDNKWHR